MPKGFGTSKKYSPTVLFNSRNALYKKPFGACSTNEKIAFTFPIKEDFYAEGVELILRKNEITTKYPLNKIEKQNGYDIYFIEIMIERSGNYFYRFEISKNNNICFVGRGENGKALVKDWLPEWQLSIYNKEYNVPQKYNGGTIYHIFVDRFCRVGEPKMPCFGTLKAWDEDIDIAGVDGVYRANDFYGGNFKGIVSMLPYLEKLGITMLYLSPVFESMSNHRYDTGDYSKIDHLLGDEQDFIDLIAKAKEKGIGIMLDGVFNHTGADSLYFNKFNHYPTLGAYQSKQSPFYDWYTFNNFPDDYECWWGITVVPTVSRRAIGYHDLIVGEKGILDKWTKLGLSGWRLDVVDELSSEFVENIYTAIKKANSNALVIGEVWEDASTKHSYGEEREYFAGKQLDGVMNYPFKKAILDYLSDNNGCAFIESVMTICENYPIIALNSCMTLLGSHDTLRVINSLAKINIKNTTKQWRKNYRLSETEYQKSKRKLLIASCLQYFLPGLPTVYYGDEIGMQGFEDPINRRPFDISKADEDILCHYQKLGKLRKDNQNIFTGMPNEIYNDDEILFIKRQNYLLITNPTKHSYNLDTAYFDILSQKQLACVDKQTAVILLV